MLFEHHGNGHTRPGLRLQRLEVFNWGTFDSTRGQVHTVQPNGETALLIGQNGSGKSTLVDALLTLLVRPVVRNYNVAAGAHKQERDERTYIKGACGRFSRDDDNRAEVQFLRPDGATYSILLAAFCNEASGKAFTVALLLHLNADGGSEKIYCFAPGERSISESFAGIKSLEKIKQQLQKRGFRSTTVYQEYHGWFAKETGVRQKAMDMFNQTVAVKDIQSLNKFIREHMLEAHRWNEKVDGLLSHFMQLSEAHQSLVKVRRQFELLNPIAETGAIYRGQAQQLEQSQRLLQAADSYFRQRTVDLFTPFRELRREELARTREKKSQLDRTLEEIQEECRRLNNEIESAGGERLRQIPLLIQNHESQAATKRAAHDKLHHWLKEAGVEEPVRDAQALARIREHLQTLLQNFDRQIAAAEKQHETLVIERADLIRALRDDEAELQALLKRQGNLPEHFVSLRRQLCEELRLPEKDLPFVAEMIAVKGDERAWESSIEMVLRGFALSLLIPQRHYRLVSQYVDRTRMADDRGRGQRLVYLKVGERSAERVGPRPGAQSLLKKLDFREGHALLPWVKGELEKRFDYRCCDNIEEFQKEHDKALTKERHVKQHGVRHEKDDRERSSDPRHFVLGWDNGEKKQRLIELIQQARDEHARMEQRIGQLERQLGTLRSRRQAAGQALEVTDFTAIDYLFHEAEIRSLQLEKQAIEENNNAIKLLKERLGEAQSRHRGAQSMRDETVKQEGLLQGEIRDADRLIHGAESSLRHRKTDGSLEIHERTFGDLDACFEEVPLTADTLLEREREFMEQRRSETDRLRQELEPIRGELGKLMNRFLRDFPDERADLEAHVDYLDSFLELREHILREDLPRHESRFKERLNEKVTQEIGILNGAFQSECSEITEKIETLNKSLRKLEYRAGTYMRLEPRQVRDREIAEFKDALRECLAGTFEGSLEADEARYLRIEKLITRLREEQRWREKVTDVRRWFDFVARELDDATGAERGYYEDSTGQSGGEKAKLAFTILVAAIAYQYDISPERSRSDRFHFVVVDEMFSKVDDQYAEYALELFRKFGLQLLIVAPLDAKARVTEPYVGCYLHVVKDAKLNHSEIFSMTAREFDDVLVTAGPGQGETTSSTGGTRPRQPR